MKKSAIILLCIPLILVGVICLHPEKADHGSSPAFSLALRDAVDKLEGAALKTTAAVSTPANASRLDLTTDPVTCTAGDPQCDGLTADDRPCYTLQDADVTCDAISPTCDSKWTCSGSYTCDDRSTCDGSMTCDAEHTCWNSTCDEPGQTCDGTSPTCAADQGCDFTMDGTHTCNGTETCFNTCESWPTVCSFTCSGPTCVVTCQVTCTDFPTCGGEETCDGTATCEDTCEGIGFPTCDVTCDGTGTCDGSGTCDGTQTCEHTCNHFQGCEDITTQGATCDGVGPTCDGISETCVFGPPCFNAVEHTTWGQIKSLFK